jgi:RNA polymerase sigma-70 factor (ECF subfamily)
MTADQIAMHHAMLTRAAHKLLRNHAWAEDAASETLMVALEKPERYGGHASVKMWLMGILRHKAVDQIRRHTRECQAAIPDEPDSQDDTLPTTASGGRVEPAAGWGDPLDSLSRREFLLDLDRCLKLLPPLQARAVLLRDCLEEETDVICQELGVNANHLFVALHRARGRLRLSLQMHAHTTPIGSVAQPAITTSASPKGAVRRGPARRGARA